MSSVRDTPPWPRITVVTPTYERAEFVRECIESVLSQDYPNLEYIICDGGSTNHELLALLKEYEPYLAWWDSQRDRGHAEAIRRGFDRSTGDILAWLCSDDCYRPGALRAVASAFMKKNADVVYGHSEIVDAEGSILKRNRAIPYCELASFTTSCLYQPAMFWTRELYERVGGKVGGPNFEYAVYEPNVDLMCRFQKARARFVRVRHVLTAIRTHESAANTAQHERVKAMSDAIFRRYYPFYGLPIVRRTIHAVMRVYQVTALCLQGDGPFLWEQLRRRVTSR